MLSRGISPCGKSKGNMYHNNKNGKNLLADINCVGKGKRENILVKKGSLQRNGMTAIPNTPFSPQFCRCFLVSSLFQLFGMKNVEKADFS